MKHETQSISAMDGKQQQYTTYTKQFKSTLKIDYPSNLKPVTNFIYKKFPY